MQAKHDQIDLGGLVLGVVGTGAVGSALALGLLERGASLRIWNRRGTEPELLSGAGAQCVPMLADLGQGVEGVIFAVSDGSLQDVAQEFAGALTKVELSEGVPVALHTAGAHGAGALLAISDQGWACAQMHPMAAVQLGDRIPADVWWGVAGDSPAAQLASRIVAALSGRVLAMGSDHAVRYHLAANLVAGGAVALVDYSLRIMEGVASEDSCRQALAALLSSAAKNLDRSGPVEALTGPQARGETGIVAAHLAALGELDPELGEAYRMLSRRMVKIARRRGQDPASGLDELERLLGEA